MRMFPEEATAEEWLVKTRWPNGIHCPKCGSLNVQTGASHKMPFRCRERQCRKRFSVKSGTVLQASNLGCRTWGIALHLALTSLKSVSSMKLHRDLEITQKSAWHLAHRIRKALTEGSSSASAGPAEADETGVGGSERNRHSGKNLRMQNTVVQMATTVVGGDGKRLNYRDPIADNGLGTGARS